MGKGVRVTERLEKNKIRVEELEIKGEDGKRIRGQLYLPEKAGGKLPLVIFCHGLGSCFRELHHGEGLARAGICCLLFDFCGGGPASLSDGAMEEMTLRSECEDLKAVISWAGNLDYVDPGQIFLQGESMGGLVSALVAAEVSAEVVRALVLWYPAFGIPEGAARRLRTGEREFFEISLGEAFDLEAQGLDVYGTIPAYRGSVLMIHGKKDYIVPPGFSRRALSAYREARLIVLPGAGHGFDGADSSAAREYSISFIRQEGAVCEKDEWGR